MKEGEPGFQETAQIQLQLYNDLKATSDLLAVVIPLGQAETWHVVNPRFEVPRISLKGYDISGILQILADSTPELHAHHSYMEEVFDGPDVYPRTRVWEVFPPQGTSFLSTNYSECTGSADLGGIGMAVYVPDLEHPIDLKLLKEYSDPENGYFSVDLLSWKRANEGFPYRHDKPESVLMNMLGRDTIASLEVANWFLKGLLNSEEIHPERVTYQSHL